MLTSAPRRVTRCSQVLRIKQGSGACSAVTVEEEKRLPCVVKRDRSPDAEIGTVQGSFGSYRMGKG
jgi:hypothetical protein